MAGLAWDDLIGSMRAVVIAVSDSLPEQDLTNAWELIDAGEPGIALENLCAQLYEYDAKLSPEISHQIRRLAVTMDLNADHLLEGLESMDGEPR